MHSDDTVAAYYFVYIDTQFGPQREGGYETMTEAEALQKKIAKRGHRNTWIVQEPLYPTLENHAH